MLAYSKKYKDFCSEINSGMIVSKIQSALKRDFSESKKKSFCSSLGSVKNALCNVDNPSNAQVILKLKKNRQTRKDLLHMLERSAKRLEIYQPED